MNTDQLRILLIEDSPVTTELCQEAFENAGVSVSMDICRDKEDLERRICATEYECIVAGYDLSSWKPIETIEIVRRLGKSIPTIIVAGAWGEEFAVECIRHGAADYLLKERLGRLPFAVRKAVDEATVRMRTNLLAAALVSQGEGIVIAKADADLSKSKIVSLNTAFTRITGYTSDDLIGKPLSVLQLAEAGSVLFADREGESPNLGRVISEMSHSRRDGTMYDAEWQTLPIHDSSGRTSHYVVMHREITFGKRRAAELARSNEELVRHTTELKDSVRRAETASRAKSDFVVSLSHEIRTPMSVIIGMADVLSTSQLTEGQAKYVEVFQRAGEDLLLMVNHLLDLSKIESGKFELERIDFDLNAVLAHTIALFEVAARGKGLSLSFHVAEGTPTRVIGDPHQLRQVLTNLIGNAVKFTEKGSIAIEASLGEMLPGPDCRVQFTVADTGVGIANDKKDLIFENFSQADASVPRLYGGTGLGLAICRALVEKMKGTIDVESAMGVGSKFRFTANFGLQSECVEAESEPAPWKILLCEDSQDNALLLHAYLEGTQYQIARVPDGKAGVERFENEHFDLVLMDMQMPILDGCAATRQIRQWEADRRQSPTPILALTAHAGKDQIAMCKSSGCTGFLTKPIRKATLLGALAEQLPQCNTEPVDDGISAEVQELVPEYLEQKRMDLHRLWTAIKSADYATISTVGHQLKASGSSYGFEEFSEIGNAIENAGKTRDLGASCTQAELLADSVSLAWAAGSNIPRDQRNGTER